MRDRIAKDQIIGCTTCKRLRCYSSCGKCGAPDVMLVRGKKWVDENIYHNEDDVVYPEDQKYVSKPVPGFGDSSGIMLLVGLAPGYHGANRTGIPFFGDHAGDLLYRTLHNTKINGTRISNQNGSSSRRIDADQLSLHGVYITNVVKCVPPDNSPSAGEFVACQKHLETEISELSNIEHVIAFGPVAYRQFVRTWFSLTGDACKECPRGYGYGTAKKRALNNQAILLPEIEGIHEPVTIIPYIHPSRLNQYKKYIDRNGNETEKTVWEVFEQEFPSVLLSFVENDWEPIPLVASSARISSAGG